MTFAFARSKVGIAGVSVTVLCVFLSVPRVTMFNCYDAMTYIIVAREIMRTY